MVPIKRVLPWIAIALAVAGLGVWAVVHQSSVDRPNAEEVDVLAGRPDPQRSMLEGQLDWALSLINGAAVAPEELPSRFSSTFLDQIPPALFAEQTEPIVAAGPYRFAGLELDERNGAASALILDSVGATHVLTITQDADDPALLVGLFVGEVEVDTGPFPAAEFALHLAAGMVLAVGGGLIASSGRRPRHGMLVSVAGVLWLGQLLELSGAALPYTVGLVSGSLAVGLVAAALVTAPDDGAGSNVGRLAIGLVALAVGASIARLLAIDTAAISLPDNLLLLGADRSWARGLARAAAAFAAIAALSVAAVALLRQWRAGWSRSPVLVPVTVAALVAGVTVTVPTIDAVVGAGRFDLSLSPVFPVAAMVAAFGLVGTALALESEELLAVQASRVRILHAGENARRQLERDLHDGAQQRLLGVMLALRLGGDRFSGRDPEFDDFLHGVQTDLATAVAELRELSRGLHPAILERGVVAAAESLAESSPVPVTVSGERSERWSASTEHAAYFVIAEALTNATRHADAAYVDIRVARHGDAMRVTIVDDGCGGATVGAGSGLQGLIDRVTALSGHWSIRSPAGVGTTIEVELPCA